MVFLHGWGTSGLVWGAQLPDLVQDHCVITVDWRGCGRSSRPAAGNTIASPAMHDWTVRQILDSGVFIDQLITDQARYDPRPIGPLAHG